MGVEMVWDNLGTSLLYNIYYGAPLCLVNGFFFEYISKIFPWDEQPRKRAWLGVIGSIIVTMITLILLNIMLWVYVWGNAFEVFWNRENRSFYLIALIITVIVSVTIHAIGFFQEVQKEKLISQRLRQEKLASELNALRSQVDPHFLFNSFNVLSGLIDEDPEKAQNFLAGLSKIYRYVLEQRNDDTSTVADELAFAREYLELQKMSKHNGFSDDRPLKINISEEEDALIISNTIQKRKNISDSAGLGLQNIIDRYSLLSKKQIEVNVDDHLFTVKLPLI